jgi:DNA-binding MarR family transcriptional regulator
VDPEIEAVRALARASSVLEGASDELNLAHYRVLSAIASGEERASRVAARLALGRPTVSAAVDSMHKRGLLERLVVDDDQRAVTLRLTGEGEQLLARVEGAMRERILALAALTADADQLLEALVWLGRAIDDWRTERRRSATGSVRPAATGSVRPPATGSGDS